MDKIGNYQKYVYGHYEKLGVGSIFDLVHPCLTFEIIFKYYFIYCERILFYLQT